MKMRPDRLELLARFDALGIEAVSFEREFGLPTAFISKFRGGRGGHGRGAETVRRFDQAIRTKESPGTAPPVGSRPAAPTSLIEAIRGAKTADQISELARLVCELMADGTIDPNLGRALNDNLSRQQQLLKEKRIEEEQVKAGEELKIRIVFENRWDPKKKG